MKLQTAVSVLLLLAVLFAGSASAAEWEPVTITDDLGVVVEITKYPERIVSLSPANTEILFALGLDERIVGVTEYCTYPEAALSKEKIGGFSTINTEKITVLNPDLIVAADGNSEETVSHLRELGYTLITINADTIERTLADILLLGKATGTSAEADELVSSMQADLAEIAEKTADLEKPKILHCMWIDPLWVSGNHTFQNEMIQYAGGINAVVTTEGWGIVTLEKFLLIDPDIIFVDTGMGMGEGATDSLKNYIMTEPRLSTLTAVQNGHVYAVNADIIDRGGPRLVEGVEAIASIAHPEIFGEYEPDRSTVSSPAPVLGIIAGLAAVYLWKRKE